MNRALIDNFGKLFSSSLLVFFLKLIGTCLAFYITVKITRGLGAEDSGVFFFFYSFIIVGSVVARVGLDAVFIRFIAPKVENNDTEIGEWISRTSQTGLKIIFFASLSITLIMIIFLLVLFDFTVFETAHKFPLCIALLSIPSIALVQSISFTFQAVNKFIVSTLLFNVLVNAAYLIILFFPEDVSFSNALYGLFNAASVSLCITLTLYFYFFPYKSKSVQSTPSIGEFLQISKPLWFTQVSNQTLSFFPIIIGGLWLTGTDVAYLSISQRIAMFLSFFLLALNYVVAPNLSLKLSNNKFLEAQKLISFVTYTSVFTALLILITIFLFSDVVLLFFGAEFLGAKYVLAMFLIGQSINVASGCANQVFVFTGHQQIVGKVAVFTLILCTVLYPSLISIMGLYGAATAFIITNLVRTLLSTFLLKRNVGINCFRLSFFRT